MPSRRLANPPPLPTSPPKPSKSVRQLCAELFRDYEFGLGLIKNTTGQKEFILPVEAVNTPDKFLSDWVVASYRNRPQLA